MDQPKQEPQAPKPISEMTVGEIRALNEDDLSAEDRAALRKFNEGISDSFKADSSLASQLGGGIRVNLNPLKELVPGVPAYDYMGIARQELIRRSHATVQNFLDGVPLPDDASVTLLISADEATRMVEALQEALSSAEPGDKIDLGAVINRVKEG